MEGRFGVVHSLPVLSRGSPVAGGESLVRALGTRGGWAAMEVEAEFAARECIGGYCYANANGSLENRQ